MIDTHNDATAGDATPSKFTITGNLSNDEYVLFFKHPTPYSQWTPAKFTVKGVEYNCAEQYMMQQKALLFGDKDTAEEIMMTPWPRQQQALGRQVKKYTDGKWEKKCFKVVKKGNLAKFRQNDQMREDLFSTYPKVLVEASPVDCKWGVGLKEDDPRVLDKSQWRGRNLLGYALTEVRQELMKEYGVLPKET